VVSDLDSTKNHSRGDEMSNEPKILRSSQVSAKFNEHVKRCDRCHASIIAVMVDLEKPLDLCEEGRKLLRDIFN